MSNSDFQILARIYDFLSQFDASDISAAGRRAVSDNIRNAIELLAKEARENGKKKMPASAELSVRNRRLPIESKPTSTSGSARRYKNDIMAFLLDGKRFPDKAALAQFAFKAGAPEAASPKYSRERVAHHIAQRAARDEKFGKDLSQLIGSLERVDPQSRGWMELILGRQ